MEFIDSLSGLGMSVLVSDKQETTELFIQGL